MIVLLGVLFNVLMASDCEDKPVLSLSSIPETDTVPFKRLYHTMDYNNETQTLIIFGGRRDLNLQFNDIWGFNINTQKYSIYYATNEFQPAARSHSGSFVDSTNSMFYVFAGLTDKGPQNDLWSFNLQSYRWRRMNPKGSIPASRYRFGSTKFYWKGSLKYAVFGGSLSTGESNDLFIYDVTNDFWTKVQPEGSTRPPKLNGSNLDYYAGFLYVVTGDVTSSETLEGKEFQGLFKYSLENNQWEEIATINKYKYRYYTQTSLMGSILYVLYGWSDSANADVEEISYMDLNDQNGQWLTLEISSCSALDSYSASVIDSNIYIFGGYSAADGTYLNRMSVMSQSSKGWTCTQINDNYEVPPARQYHSLSAINGELYIFGGLGASSLLGDMWKLSKNNEWQSINTLGSPPSSRYGHSVSSTGDMIALWGGFSDAGYQNDLYLFSTFNNYWKKIEPVGVLPSGKLGACLILDLPVIYLFGGKSNAGLSNELWLYDTSNNTYTQVKAEDPPDARYYCNCEVLDNKLWIMMGTGESDKPLGSIYQFDLDTLIWTKFANEDYPPQSRSLGATKHFNSFILSLGGEAWTTDPMDSVFLIDIETKNFTCVGRLPIYFYAGAFTLIETTLYLYGGGSLIGDSLRLSVPSLSFNYLELKQLSEFSKTCSPGSYFNNKTTKCETCKAGYYSESYYTESCQACPAGTYNSYDGATSESQCYPCAYGTYSNKTSATFCLQCPVGKICPIGSTMYYEDSEAASSKSEQPDNYSPDERRIRDKQTIVLSVIFGIGFISFLCFLAFPFIQAMVREIDMYYEEHNYEMNSLMYITKNKTGGGFFCGFCLVALVVIGLSWINFVDDNIIEEKTLRPIVVLDEIEDHIEGTFTVKAEFYNYGGDCKSNGDQLNSKFIVEMQSSSVQYTQVSTSNKPSGSSCLVELTCSKCELAVGDYISISLNEPESYCSSISVNITSDSSIPNDKSTMQTYLSSTSYKVFRGYDPTVFYFKMTPSFFRSDSDKWPEKQTGYHVSVDINPTLGSEYMISEIPFSSGLNLKVSLDLNKDGLYTERSYKQTSLAFLATLLGSVFGIMGAFDSAMRIFEQTVKNVSKIMDKKSEANLILNNREKFAGMLSEGPAEEEKSIEEKSSFGSLITPRA